MTIIVTKLSLSVSMFICVHSLAAVDILFDWLYTTAAKKCNELNLRLIDYEEELTTK